MTSIDRVAGGFQLEFARYNTNWGYDRPNLRKLAFEFELKVKRAQSLAWVKGDAEDSRFGFAIMMVIQIWPLTFNPGFLP